MSDPIHPVQTQRSSYKYQFTAKHHGGGKLDDACWGKNITRAEEFAVFDVADLRDISDEAGRLYGVLRGDDGLRTLGTWHQQLAEFSRARANVPWHGYPIWALNELAPPNRSGQQARPAKEVFVKLEAAGLITPRERKRLYKGEYA